jgi:hypothetical protein
LQKIGLASAPRCRKKKAIGGVAERVLRHQVIRQPSGQFRAMVEEESHESIPDYFEYLYYMLNTNIIQYLASGFVGDSPITMHLSRQVYQFPMLSQVSYVEIGIRHQRHPDHTAMSVEGRAVAAGYPAYAHTTCTSAE